MTLLAYNQIQQKSSHNSFARNEAMQDQFFYHNVASFELDLETDSTNGDWTVEHIGESSDYDYFSDALQELKTIHDETASHPVITLFIDLNVIDSQHTVAQFDALFDQYLGDWLYTPYELSASGTKTLQQGAADGWPAVDALAGKFICVVTKKQADYLGNEAINRTCFATENPSDADDVDAASSDYVFFNMKHGVADDLCLYVHSEGYIGRAYPLLVTDPDNQANYEASEAAKCNHLATDQINYHQATWTTMHDSTGYPFQVIAGETGAFDADKQQRAITVSIHSGDLPTSWLSGGDDFNFRYKALGGSSYTSVWTGYISAASDSIEDYVKGSFMARLNADPSKDKEKYFAVIRNADNKKLRIQWRSSSGSTASSQDAPTIPPTGCNDQANRIFVKLSCTYDGSSETTCSGYGSHDGQSWTLIGSKTISGNLQYQGITSSSHDESQNADGSKIRLVFGNLKHDGTNQMLTGLSSANIGDVSSCTAVDGLY